jgi:hypothetical protein
MLKRYHDSSHRTFTISHWTFMRSHIQLSQYHEISHWTFTNNIMRSNIELCRESLLLAVMVLLGRSHVDFVKFHTEVSFITSRDCFIWGTRLSCFLFLLWSKFSIVYQKASGNTFSKSFVWPLTFFQEPWCPYPYLYTFYKFSEPSLSHLIVYVLGSQQPQVLHLHLNPLPNYNFLVHHLVNRDDRHLLSSQLDCMVHPNGYYLHMYVVERIRTVSEFFCVLFCNKNDLTIFSITKPSFWCSAIVQAWDFRQWSWKWNRLSVHTHTPKYQILLTKEDTKNM